MTDNHRQSIITSSPTFGRPILRKATSFERPLLSCTGDDLYYTLHSSGRPSLGGDHFFNLSVISE